MFEAETKIRVRYGETDQMGYVYYGNYAQYFEVGRVEALRELGLSYREMEEMGVMLPVVDFKMKYMKPALYDDQITVKTYIKKIPTAKITFEYACFNEKGEQLNFGETTLVFVDKETMRPRGPVKELVDELKRFIN